MIVAEPTNHNIRIIDKIADLESDIELFHREWSDEVIDKKLEELSELYRQLE